MMQIIEDKLLVWEFKRGSTKALQRIYEKYVAYLVTVATAGIPTSPSCLLPQLTRP